MDLSLWIVQAPYLKFMGSHAYASWMLSKLLLDHFHSHWRLIHEGAPELLLEPRQFIEPMQHRNSAVPRSSTKRVPSQFEAVEAQAAPAHLSV